MRMNFPSEHCVIARPRSSSQEQGLPPCPGRLGMAQKRETEAHPGVEIPEDPNPCCKPRWMLNTPSATPGVARSLHSLPGSPLPTATQGATLASPSPGITQPWHCSTVAQPCPHA